MCLFANHSSYNACVTEASPLLYSLMRRWRQVTVSVQDLVATLLHTYVDITSMIASRGAFYTIRILCFHWWLYNVFKISGNKMHWHIFSSIAGQALHFPEWIFCIYCNGWVDCRRSFHFHCVEACYIAYWLGTSATHAYMIQTFSWSSTGALCAEVHNNNVATNKFNQEMCNFVTVVIKLKKQEVVIYTPCSRYSSGHLISNSYIATDWIKD